MTKKPMTCDCVFMTPLGDGRKRRKGNCGIRLSPNYKIWLQMKYRCRRGTRYEKNYSARGIKICTSWMDDFKNFESDMGPRPSIKHSVDRIDNDGNYCPHNCRWATQHEQILNSRSVGDRKNLSKWVYRTYNGKFSVKRSMDGVQVRAGTFTSLREAKRAAKMLESA